MSEVSARVDLPMVVDAESLLKLVPASSNLFLILDYDGTLVPFQDVPDQARPDAELLTLLANLSERPNRRLSLVTGRTRVQVEKWFGALPVGLYAEHGVWCRTSRDEGWRRCVEPVDAWPPDIVDALQKASDMLPGSLWEVKSASLTFHFRAVRRDWVNSTIPWLRTRLGFLAGQYSFRFVEGADVLELRAPGVSKASAAKMIQAMAPTGAGLVAIGDDATDEDMFRALRSDAVTVHVGSGRSAARYAIEGPQEVRYFLSRL